MTEEISQPTPEEVEMGKKGETAEEEGEKYQGGEIPRVESDETQKDN
jgi:hypothetical protein